MSPKISKAHCPYLYFEHTLAVIQTVFIDVPQGRAYFSLLVVNLEEYFPFWRLPFTVTYIPGEMNIICLMNFDLNLESGFTLGF